MDKKLEDHLKSLLKDKGEELEKTLGCLIDGDVSLDNLNKIWKKRVKQKDCGKEEYPAVERIIDKFIEWEKNFGEAYHKLGNIYYRRKFYEEAKSNYKKALKIEEWEKEEDKAWCYHDLGYLLYGAREYKDAVDNYNEAIKIAKKLKKEKSIAWFYIDLGTARMKSGRYEAADKAFDDALSLIKKDKDKAYVYNALGRLYYRKRLYEEARKKLEQAKEHNPDLDKVYNNLGLLDLEAGSYENAKLCFQKAIEMDKSEKKFFFCLAEKDARIFLFNLEQEIKVPEDGIVPINSELYKKFVHIGEPLSDNAKLSTIDKKSWEIVDGERRYGIEKIDKSLKVYYKVLLKDGPIEPELKNKLEREGVPLPTEPFVNKENGKWVITDKKKC
jgi:tetratricopeptide (TPR) repeat protein